MEEEPGPRHLAYGRQGYRWIALDARLPAEAYNPFSKALDGMALLAGSDRGPLRILQPATTVYAAEGSIAQFAW